MGEVSQSEGVEWMNIKWGEHGGKLFPRPSTRGIHLVGDRALFSLLSLLQSEMRCWYGPHFRSTVLLLIVFVFFFVLLIACNTCSKSGIELLQNRSLSSRLYSGFTVFPSMASLSSALIGVGHSISGSVPSPFRNLSIWFRSGSLPIYGSAHSRKVCNGNDAISLFYTREFVVQYLSFMRELSMILYLRPCHASIPFHSICSPLVPSGYHRR